MDSTAQGWSRPSRMTLNVKLVLSFLVIGVLPALVIGWYSVTSSAGYLEEAAGQRLEDAAVTDGDIIDRNLFERYGDVQAFAANPMARGSATERQEIVDFLTVNYGIYDLMLIVDLDGRILTANTVDGAGDALDTSSLIGESVAAEPWFDVVSSGQTPDGGTYYTDVHRSPRIGEIYGAELLTLPFTAPIHGADGEIVGIWHNEASFERVVGDVMDQRRDTFAQQGLSTIETQVLRQDGVVIDDADPDAVLELDLAQAGLEAATEAIGTQGVSGYTIEPHLRTEVDQINGFAVTDGALGFPGYGWGILVREDVSEAAAPAAALRRSVMLTALLAMAVTAAAGLWLARSLSGPLKRNVSALRAVSDGDLRVRFEASSGDEVGHMGAALNTALDSIGDTLGQAERSADALSGSASHLNSVSRELNDAAGHASAQASEVAAASEEIAVSSSSVAQAMEQMDLSVREISTTTADAAAMTEQAVTVAGTTTDRMAKLDNSAAGIGDVVNVITNIAEQTNLLALNATIEAARVGEAGKGFAVVANEVKELAAQTAHATGEIQEKVEAIQTDTVEAVQAMGEISELIESIRDASTTIASAVEEQSATTKAIGSSIQAVTAGTNDISERILSVASATDATTDGATKTLEAAGHLGALAEQLANQLSHFQLPTVDDDPAA